LRLWLAVCLALYVAIWLELDNAYWAGASAAIMCQPSLGACIAVELVVVFLAAFVRLHLLCLMTTIPFSVTP
jgi:uncharacterized membrane protein YccC